VIVVFLGFLLSQLCFFILQPECVSTSIISSASASKSFGTVKTIDTTASRQPDIVIGARSHVVPSSFESSDAVMKRRRKKPTTVELEFPTTAKFPPQYTSEQLGVLAEQLPGQGCLDK
jgi:hypothetical protein